MCLPPYNQFTHPLCLLLIRKLRAAHRVYSHERNVSAFSKLRREGSDALRRWFEGLPKFEQNDASI